MVLNVICWLPMFGVVFGRGYQPVKDVNGSYLCAIDPPMVVFAAADIVGIPEGVPDVVRCGYGCTGFTNCTSFNHKSSLQAVSGVDGSSWGSVCELFNYVPRNCMKSTSYKRNSQCVHYRVAGENSSYQPVICDPKCVSGCDKQRDGKCDFQCVTGWGLSDTFTCKPCGSNCTGGCLVQGAGKCDSQCRPGFGIANNYTCQVNLAYTRDSFQVTTYMTAYALYAVDGNNQIQSCTESLGGILPWWAVDLLQPTVVSTVKVINDPQSSFAGRLNNFKVGVTNISPAGRVALPLNEGTDYALCAQYCCSVPAGATAKVTCTPRSTLYRYVIIQGTTIGSPICLNEVEVYAV